MNGDSDMERPTDISDVLTVRGAGIGFGGYGLGGYAGGGRGSFASPEANAVRINGVESTVNQHASCINGTLESLTRTLSSDATNKNIIDGNMRICDRLSAMENQRGQDLLFVSRELSAIRAEGAKQAADATIENLKCCCETQKLVISENSKTREEFQKSLLEEARAQLAAQHSHGHHG